MAITLVGSLGWLQRIVRKRNVCLVGLEIWDCLSLGIPRTSQGASEANGQCIKTPLNNSNKFEIKKGGSEVHHVENAAFLEKSLTIPFRISATSS